MIQTQTSSLGTDKSIAAIIPTGKQIYDGIMQGIEPDLLSDNLPKLKEQHKGETEEEHTERMKRYTEAFKKYDATYDEWLSRVRTAVKERRQEALKKAEMKTRNEEEETMKELEASFVNPIPTSPKTAL